MDPQEIINKFIQNNYKPMQNIPNNRVFYTEVSASTLVWVEDRVVIEHYFLFPNLETHLHYHPFENQMIYIFGDITAYRKMDSEYVKKFTPEDAHKATSIMPIGYGHGFTVGESGAIVYNIQIWPDIVTNPLSAAVEYFGETLGPKHIALIETCKG